MTHRSSAPRSCRIALFLFALCTLGRLAYAVHGESELEAGIEWGTEAVARSSAPEIEGTLEWSTSFGSTGAVTVTAGWADAAGVVALPSEAELSERLESLALSEESRARLRATWTTVVAALNAIRSLPVPTSVRTIETCLETLETSLDAFLADVEATASDHAGTAPLLAGASELERHADRLESIASRIRLYAKGACATALTADLENAARTLANADRDSYRSRLGRLADGAEAARGADLRRDAADSIRAACDALLRRLGVRTLERSLDVAGSTEILGLDLDVEFAAARTASVAPSGGTRSLSAAGAATHESGDTEVALSFSTNAVQVDDRLRETAAKTTSEIEASAACRLGEIDLEARITTELERRPLQIDAEIEDAGIPSAQSVVATLAQQVTAEVLASTTKRLLLADLADAEAALGEARRGDAADAVEDFIDHVESERWKGKVPAETAARWIDRAMEIQPRRSVRRLEIPIAIEVPIADDSVDVELEWSRVAYPANAALGSTKSAAAATWSTERNEWSIDTSAERTRTRYPAAPTKDTSTSELALELERPLAVGDLALAAKIAHRVRHAAPENDRDDVALSGSWSGTWNGISLSLEASEKARRYPNAPSPLGTRTRASTLDAAFPLGGGTLGVTWETENARTSEGDPDLDTTALSVDWEYEADDVNVSLSVDWEERTDWTSPAKDRRGLTLAAELTIPF
ncbi:MAG: hypothetical protein ABFD77_01720 [Thermotogota bacterium]